MRLLLIAYEFPPSPSPQSLRWTYLVRELAALGHDVHVLAPELGGDAPGLPSLPASVVVHRTFAGPFRGLLATLRNRRRRLHGSTASASAAASAANESGTANTTMLRPPRNWKQRISEAVQSTVAYVLFPDIRGEWKPWAERALRRLLPVLRPDVVIASHEPATSLQLGLLAQRAGYRWVADLGDPVVAAYTPARWRQRAQRVEAATCRHADLLIVTNTGTAELMRERHARTKPVEVLPQGFDAAPAAVDSIANPFDPARMELFYSGSLYRFRRIDALLHALECHPALRLNIAAITVPESVLAAAQAAPDRIRLLGFLPHAQVLELQRSADVLVNLANDGMVQIPGKFYEYLGAGRPILHLGSGDDPVARMILALRRGWVCANSGNDILSQLRTIAQAKLNGSLDDGLRLDSAAVIDYSWQRIGARLDAALRALPPSHVQHA